MLFQHRMRPEIARLLTPHIYQDLKNHPSVLKYEQIKVSQSSPVISDGVSGLGGFCYLSGVGRKAFKSSRGPGDGSALKSMYCQGGGTHL